MVAVALGVADGVRDDWAPYDLKTVNGIRVEVKSAAYVQSWSQRGPSSIRFSIRPARAWDPKTNTLMENVQRHADVYIFCLLSHMDQTTVNPLELDQWEFYVASTSMLARHVSDQKTIGLSALKKIARGPIAQIDLAPTVRAVLPSLPPPSPE
ncbi:MAG: hypothetical protein DHS20C21_09220 [Gemmatimonadota bacterium]|nr:MAG: hypothetical protein DHS20C21_09220 [Gemmatimonadota bacterium]